MDTGADRSGEHRMAVRFVGSGSEYFRIWIVNLLLTLVTLGLYYPFAKVRRLRYFHGATEIGGHALAFHAEPWKMLRGYLLVAALLGVYSLAGHVSPTAGLVAFVIAAALWPALWHSSLRFRLANTGWRGLRLRFTGSRRDAYRAMAPGFVIAFFAVALGALAPPEQQGEPPGAALWLGAALPLLLLLAMPALLWLLRRYQHAHYALAGEHSRFGVPMSAFYGLALRAGAWTMLVGLLAAAAMFLLVSAVGIDTNDPDGSGRAMGLRFVVAFFVVFGAYQAVIGPYVTTRLQNMVWNGTRSEHLRFESTLGVAPMLALTLKNWLLVVLTLGLYFPFARVATARLRLQAVTLVSTLPPDELTAQPGSADEAAAGDAAADMVGLDIGL